MTPSWIKRWSKGWLAACLLLASNAMADPLSSSAVVAHETDPRSSSEATAHETNTLEWDYSNVGLGDEGWGELSPDFAACTIGTSQSPINITYTSLANLPALGFDYGHTEDAKLMVKDHTLVIALSGKNTLTIGPDHYQLHEIRFHTPAEHAILGKDALLEIQMIHHDDKGKTLIVSLFNTISAENSALTGVIDHTMAHQTNLKFSPEGLLPEKHGYYSYTGSLTWPPCTEGVEWRIFKSPIGISQKQFQALAGLLSRNARMAQPVYLRTVLESRD